MNTILKLVAVLALVVAGQAMAQSTITYTLELGGDNHVADYEDGLYPQYTRLPNGDLDGQTYNVGDTINWAALVEVGGTHQGGLGDGLAPAGAANLVFTLELKDASGTVLLSAGGPAAQGWYSTINDGDDDGARGLIEGPDPLENAAFPTVFDIDGYGSNGGRLFDIYDNGGPGMTYYHYPSADGRPSAAVVTDGKLHGMGAGYEEFDPTMNQTGGVGLASNTTECTALGVLPLFEGQINTDGLAAGSYTLELTVEQGNNILPGLSGICSSGSTVGTFAVAANQVTGDTIQFNLSAGCTEPVVTAAVSRKTHGSAGTFDQLAGCDPVERDGQQRLDQRCRGDDRHHRRAAARDDDGRFPGAGRREWWLCSDRYG